MTSRDLIGFCTDAKGSFTPEKAVQDRIHFAYAEEDQSQYIWYEYLPYGHQNTMRDEDYCERDGLVMNYCQSTIVT